MRAILILLAGVVLLGACNPGNMQDVPSIPTETPTAAAVEPAWVSDAEKQTVDPDGEQGWVAAWFATEDALPESVTRWWIPVDDDHENTPEASLERSVELLAEPPPGWTSAFAQGLTVHDVSFAEGRVLIDLDARSPGLYGHGSTGFVIGSEQLTSTAAFYFPEAETLCIAYDGEPTTIEAGGPSFLHDASGCPLPLH